MKLKEYISWTNSIDEYKDSASLAKFLITDESKIPEEPTKDLPGSSIISSFILENNFSTNLRISSE